MTDMKFGRVHWYILVSIIIAQLDIKYILTHCRVKYTSPVKYSWQKKNAI